MAVDLSQPIKDYTATIGGLLKNRGEERKKTYRGYKDEYGVTDRMKGLEDIRRSIADSERILSNLPKNVKSRVAGRGNMTQAQYDRLLANESQGVSNILANQARSEQSSRIGLDNIMGEISTLMGMDEQNFRDTLTELANRRSRKWADRDKAWQAEQNSLSRAASRAATPSFDYSYLQKMLDDIRNRNRNLSAGLDQTNAQYGAGVGPNFGVGGAKAGRSVGTRGASYYARNR